MITEESTHTPAEETTTTVVTDAAPVVENPQVETPVEVAPKSLKDADEATQLKAINDLLGTNYKSMAEARPAPKKSAEEIEAEKAEAKRKSLEWAIANGKVSQESIEKAAVLKAKAQRDVALDLFAEEYLEVNPQATREEAEESFKEFYQEHLDENNSTRVIAKKRMEKLVSEYVAENTKSIDSIDKEYEEHVTHEQKYGNYSSKVKGAIKAQPKEVKISVPYVAEDGVELDLEYSIPVDDKIIEAVKKEFSHENTFYALGAHENEVDETMLQTEVANAIRLRALETGIKEAFKQHAQRVEKDVIAREKNVRVTRADDGFIKRPFQAPQPPKQQIVHTFNNLAQQGKL